LGLTQTTPGPGSSWGLTTTSAADQLRLLVDLTSPSGPLAAPGRAYLLDLMTRVEGDQVWGVAGIAVGGDALAVKNGWLPLDGDDGDWVVNSIGRIAGPARTLLVAVLSDSSPDMDSGISVVQRVAALAAGAVRTS
ncbi:MAG: serine hydrolase, partial [Actinomycetota bacterium]|nr:serine hydrolase [Actinomycetota bacterium]